MDTSRLSPAPPASAQGGDVDSPAAVAPGEMAMTAQTLQYSTPQKPPISRERMLAGRSCIVLATLLFAFSGCLGISTVALLVSGARGRSPAVLALTIGIMMVLSLGSAAAYLWSGISIRRGGIAAVIVAMVLAVLQEIGSLLYFAAAIFQALTGGGNLFGLFVAVLAVAAFAQLIYHLIKVLNQGRTA